MNNQVSKSDWKHFKIIRERALNRLCEQALESVAEIAADGSMTHHERYIQVYDKIQEFDTQIADGFDNLSRSRMLQQLIFMRSRDLVSDSDMEQFTDSTKDVVARFLDL